jgi:methionine sulfoxide reductase catalytic subunit
VWWLLPARLIGAGLFILAAKIFIATGAGRSFINAHRCVQSSPSFRPGVSAWVIATHAANFLFMVMIVCAGWQILADHPPACI